MARRTAQTKDLSGPKYYLTKLGLVEEAPCFVYEVCIHRYKKNEYSLYDSKIVTSNKLLIPKKSKYTKQGDALYEKSISLIGVPIDFIRKYELSEYKPLNNKNKK